jgi:Putative peptidoglycan binding domain
MRSFKGTFAGLFMAGILALAPTAAFAHGGGGGGGHGGGGGGFGGGHGGGFGGGGGHFGGGGSHFGGGGSHFAGGGHFVGGGSHFTGYTGHSFAGHSFAGRSYGDHRDHFRHDRGFFFGEPYWYGYDYPYYGYYGYDYPYYGYDDSTGDYYDGQYSPAAATPSQETIVAVQKELTQLGYYHGPADGLIGPQTEKAIRWFQSVDKLTVNGQIDNPTLKALRIS